MNQKQKHINPMKFAGTSREQRILKALLPSSAPVDQRTTADLIVFAKNYASFLNFFNSSDTPTTDWKRFMEMDVSVTLAIFSKLDVKKLSAFVKDVERKIQNSNKEKELKKYFKSLFDFNFSLTQMLNNYYEALPDDTDFKSFFKVTVQSLLPEYYARLVSFYHQAISEELIVPTETYLEDSRPDEFILSQDFKEENINSILWIKEEEIIEGEYVLNFDEELNFGEGSIKEKIKNAISHNLFSAISTNYLKVFTSLINRAVVYLNDSLNNYSKHTPHYALFLTFLRLFKISQDHLNGYTNRHLNLYYNEILQLNKKEAQPDAVYLIIEPSKSAPDRYLIEKDTVFKAGKDRDGEELFYKSKQDFAISKVSVEAVKNVFVQERNNTKQVFASEIASSEDGEGSPSTYPDKSWLPFGDAKRPKAEIGFAILSQDLLLEEGERQIIFNFYLNQTLSTQAHDLKNDFLIKLTSKDGWMKQENFTVTISKHGNKSLLSFKIELSAADAAIVGYDPDLHIDNHFETMRPVALFLLKNAAVSTELWVLKIDKIDINIKVTGLKDLKISNDFGRIDISKPFEPFGGSPKIKSSLMIGNSELFSKAYRLPKNKKMKVTLHVDWDNYGEIEKLLDKPEPKIIEIEQLNKREKQGLHEINELPDRGIEKKVNEIKIDSDYQIDISFLNNGSWVSVDDSQQILFPIEKTLVKEAYPLKDARQKGFIGKKGKRNPSQEILVIYFQFVETPSEIILSFDGLERQINELDNTFYGEQSIDGFFKINLLNDFGHSTYLENWINRTKDATYKIAIPKKNYTVEQLIEMVQNNAFAIDLPSMPEKPYIPRINNIKLDYEYTTSLDLSNEGKESEFMAIYPFGFNYFDDESKNYFLPSLKNEGTLFIGLKNLKAKQVLSLLFALAEGTANPERDNQPVTWFYLDKEQRWKAFDKEKISDGTKGIIQTGIIQLSIDEDVFISDDEDALSWLMLTMKEKTDAICRIVDIQANAVEVYFDDYKNRGNYFKEILPKGSVTKLLYADKYIKKIEQPFDSFNGIPTEKEEEYYTRVSERLRHKNRAVGIWDYETMILDAFPEVYQIKCLNHTQLTEEFYSEMKPGYVLLIPIPDLKGKQIFNSFEALMSKAKLNDIKEFVQKKVSPHVHIGVSNPVFEKVMLEFKVKYQSDDFTLLTKRLRVDLESFLAPWAYGRQTHLEFGTKLHKSTLINFMEKLPYVDIVADIKMYHIVPGENYKRKDADSIEASTGRSVLISVSSELDNNNGGHKIEEWNN